MLQNVESKAKKLNQHLTCRWSGNTAKLFYPTFYLVKFNRLNGKSKLENNILENNVNLALLKGIYDF